MADLTGGVGSEQSGMRPVIVVQNDVGNGYSNVTIVCPLTTKLKNYSATHITVSTLSTQSYIMCEQIRVVDKSRLKRKICNINDTDSKLLKEKLKLTLDL